VFLQLTSRQESNNSPRWTDFQKEHLQLQNIGKRHAFKVQKPPVSVRHRTLNFTPAGRLPPTPTQCGPYNGLFSKPESPEETMARLGALRKCFEKIPHEPVDYSSMKLFQGTERRMMPKLATASSHDRGYAGNYSAAPTQQAQPENPAGPFSSFKLSQSIQATPMAVPNYPTEPTMDSGPSFIGDASEVGSDPTPSNLSQRQILQPKLPGKNSKSTGGVKRVPKAEISKDNQQAVQDTFQERRKRLRK